MKIAICDDIPEYRLSIKCYTEEYFRSHHIDNTIDEYSNGTSLANSDIIYDIVFIDIELGDSCGINIAKKIKSKYQNTLIVIVTSYRQYLNDAIDINVLRYIDKPITQKHISDSLDKALSVINETIITLHTKNNQILRLKTSEIIFAEAKLKKVTVYTKSNCFIIKENLKQLKEILTASYFAIPHNSFIVNMNYISCFKREEIKLISPYSNQRISIATRKQPEFKRKFLDFIGEDCTNE